uniref:TPM domain-containing protein n=1 Tax=Panagrolaimus superbus TaxID=310955 RepID=A0A914XSL2_9BILA
MNKLIYIFSSFIIFVNCNPGFTYYTPDTYPDSQRDYQLCKLSKPGLICDPNEMLGDVTNLNSTAADYIDPMLTEIQKTTNCSCQDFDQCFITPFGKQGVTISVALLKSISADNIPEEQTPEGRLHLIQNFANALRNRQQRGSCDDDILIVITPEMIYTAVGTGTSPIISKDAIDKVDKIVLPYLQSKDYTRAIVEMTRMYSSALKGEDSGKIISKPWYSPLPLWSVYAIGGGILAVIIVIILVIIMVLKRKQKTRGYSVGSEARRNGQNSRL